MSMQIGNFDLGVGFVGDTTGLTRALNQAGGDVEKFGSRTRGEMRGVARETAEADDAMARLARGIKGAFVGGSVAVGLITFKNTITDAVGSLIDAQVQLDRMRNGFNFGAGGMQAGSREIAFLREEVNRLGLDLGGASNQYMKLVAASRGSEMQGEKTRELFIAIAEASTVMGLGVDQSERAMMAVTQMMSKGKVMAEELRGQLGEQLPGAFAIAARAMGVTEIELNKLLETGQVYSADFLPKFAAQLRKELGGAVEESTKSMQASLNRFSTAWLDLKQQVVQAGVGGFIAGQTNLLSDAIENIAVRMSIARKTGDGFWGQTAEGAIGVIQFLNPLNAFSYTAQNLDGRIKQVKDGLVTLQEQFAKQPDSPYLRIRMLEAQELVRALESAKAAKDALDGKGPNFGGQANYGNEGRREESRQGDAKLIKERQDALAAFWAKNMTPAQKMNAELKTMRESLGGMFTPEIEAQIRKNYIKPVRDSGSAVREAEAAERERASTLQKIADMQARAGDAYQKDADALMNSNDALRTEIELIGLDEAGRRALMIVKEQELLADKELLLISLQNADADAATIANLEREINLRKQRIGLLGQQSVALEAEAAAKAATKAAEEYTKDADRLREREAAEWAKTWDQVGQSFTDALMQGGKSVKQYLEGLFRTMVLRPLLAPITGAVGSVFGGPAAAGQAGGGSLGMLSSLQSAYNGISTGFSGIGASVGSIGASFQYGTTAFSQQSTMLAAQEAGMGTLTGNLASAGSMLGGALVGFMAGKMISGGYSAIGKSGNAATVAGTALGAILGGPIGAVIGGALGGVFNRAFGRKAPVSTGSGIVGSFSTSGANVQGYNDQFAKGGWFRSNKSWTEYSAVSSDLDKFLDASLMQITGATRAYADLLGLNADAVNGITQSIKLSLAGMNAEQQQEAIMGALSGFGDKLAEQLLGTYSTVYDAIRGRKGRIVGYQARQVWTPGEFLREGETAGAALTRLATSLSAVNIVFDTLNTTLMKGSLIGADAASKLLDAFGGAEAFTAQTSAYYEAFYTQAERTNTATRQLTEVLAGLGLALPESRTAFRELVEAQDLYTDAGRSTYAALIGLAPVFDQITQATEQMGKALSDEVLRLRGLLTGSSVNSVGALQADFAIATAAARAGDAGALERLPAISQALESAAALQAVTAADLALVRGQLTASLSQTMQALGLDVPQFAVGTNYVPRDMIAKIHEGEAIIPKAYNPAAGGNDAMVAELRAVRAELEGLRAEVRADVGHNAKTARILERVTPDGTSLSTVVAA
jgi:tape measure domain-containing protein